MSGPEHYAKAEELLSTRQFAEAQVHATLALAAATADTIVTRWLGDENTSGSDWTRVTS